MSVVSATVQPSSTSPSRCESGTRTSLKNTSLNVAPPVIWRSGRTSTPGACMSTSSIVRPLCFGFSVFVRVMISPMSENCAPGRPHLLAGDDPLVAVTLGLGLDAGEVRAGDRLGEQLAADDVAAVHRAQVALPHLGDRVGEDRRRDHAEADAERRRARRVVAAGDLAVATLVVGGQRPPAVLLGALDPAEAGVELLGLPLLRRGELGGFLFRRLLVEHADRVGAFAPDELLFAPRRVRWRRGTPSPRR